jgi:hypothetical protein
MAESTLNLTRAQIQAKLGTFAGWGTSPGGWSAYQQAVIDDATESGQRRFYFPEAVDGMEPWEWSFLRPTSNLALAQGATTIPLPDDFGGVVGQVTVLSSQTTSQPWKINWVTPDWLRLQYSLFPNSIGPPAYVAEDPLKGTTGTQGQRSQLLVWPAADMAYTLQLNYFVTPDATNGTFPYALGGPEHAETILESCLAVMEERLDDLMDGPHAQAFRRRLVASMAQDRKKKPPRYGKNADNSDNEGLWDRSLVHYWNPPCTYNGNSFG